MRSVCPSVFAPRGLLNARVQMPCREVPYRSMIRMGPASTDLITRSLANRSCLGSINNIRTFSSRPRTSAASSSVFARHSSTDSKSNGRILSPSPTSHPLERHKSQPTGLIQRALSRIRPLNNQDESYPSLKEMWMLAATQRRSLLLALALLLLSSGVTLTVPALIGRLIDLFGNDSTHAFWGLDFSQVAPILVAVFAIGAAAKAGSNILFDMSAIRLVRNLRHRTFSSALRQDVEWADKHAGDVVSRLSVDTSIVGDSLTSDLGDGLRAAVTVVAAGTAMLWISTDLTYLMLGIIPPSAVAAVWFGRYIRGLTHKTQDAVGKMTDVAQERLSPSAFRTIATYNGQGMEDRRLLTEIKKITNVQITEAKAEGYFYAGMGFIGNCAILTLLAYGGSLVSKGALTTGDLTSLMMYTAYLGGGLTNLTSFFASIMRGMGAGARVFSLMKREPHIRSGKLPISPGNTDPTIEFRHVHFSYPSRPERPILQDFSLTIKPGTSVALCGSSGVGKSSVHSLVLRLYDPDSGQVHVAGHDVKEYDLDSLRSLFGVVGQDPIMFEGTIADNIAYSRPGATRDEIEAAAESSNCMDFIRALPLGLDTNARQLSGGQRQRISIARSLLRGAPILLMDEATSALDTNSEHQINRTIEQIVKSGRATVWIIAHRLSTIKSADVIVVLEEGRVAEVGNFAELNVPGSKFEKLIRAQLTDSDGKLEHSTSHQPKAGGRSAKTQKREDEDTSLLISEEEMDKFTDEFVELSVRAAEAAEKARKNVAPGALGLDQSELSYMIALVDQSQPVPQPPPTDPLEELAAAQMAERMVQARE